MPPNGLVFRVRTLELSIFLSLGLYHWGLLLPRNSESEYKNAIFLSKFNPKRTGRGLCEVMGGHCSKFTTQRLTEVTDD